MTGFPIISCNPQKPSVLIDEYPTAITNFDSPYQSGSQQKPLIVTETGYFTGVAPQSIDELTHAKYVPRIFAEYFRHGISKTFVYEFVDEGTDGGMENSFGLVRADLTPKPAYTALQSMIGLLQDSGGRSRPQSLHTDLFQARISLIRVCNTPTIYFWKKAMGTSFCSSGTRYPMPAESTVMGTLSLELTQMRVRTPSLLR